MLVFVPLDAAALRAWADCGTLATGVGFAVTEAMMDAFGFDDPADEAAEFVALNIAATDALWRGGRRLVAVCQAPARPLADCEGAHADGAPANARPSSDGQLARGVAVGGQTGGAGSRPGGAGQPSSGPTPGGRQAVDDSAADFGAVEIRDVPFTAVTSLFVGGGSLPAVASLEEAWDTPEAQTLAETQDLLWHAPSEVKAVLDLIAAQQ
ncbi:MAG: hypothetical protein LBR32_02040 [Propionibacteriaceae bacterium]|jgi:hypothetical protein|nr:hypothetical protein [Propionibacteriaceae bacterium]